LLALDTDRIAIVLMVASEAVIAAVLLPAFARNKVEGLALTKLTNIMAVVPLLALIPSPWRFLGGVVPSFWIGEIMFGVDPKLPDPLILLFALTVHAAWSVAALWLFSRRVG
jgi:fluoroquinolone transport system permease protein